MNVAAAAAAAGGELARRTRRGRVQHGGAAQARVTIAQAEANLKNIARALEQNTRAERRPERHGDTLTETTIFPGMRGMLMLAGGVLMTIVGSCC